MSEGEDSPKPSKGFDIDYSPRHFLRCHSKQRKDAADVKTQVWQCAFEPSTTVKDGTTNIVATCGGNSVCFVDVESGDVKKKYYASNSRENFLALTWTTIDGHNILAAGGSVQTVYFISYEEGYCFHEEKFDRSIMAAKYGITSVLFHPVDTHMLYCSCSNGKIIVVDIGKPAPPRYTVEAEIIHLYQVHCEVFLLVYYLPKEIILATSDDGIYCWRGSAKHFIQGPVGNDKVLLQFPGRAIALTESPSLVDTVEVLENGLIASKCVLRGSIYIWNIENVIKQQYDEDVTLRITPLYQLQWSDTDNYFMYLGYDKGSKLLACGDDKGAIWTYDLRDMMKRQIQGDSSADAESMVKPTTIFEWPHLNDQYSSRKRKLNLECFDIVINKCILSYMSKYMVTVTNNNMVCIWKKKSKSKEGPRS